jgi:hypothetical protein
MRSALWLRGVVVLDMGSEPYRDTGHDDRVPTIGILIPIDPDNPQCHSADIARGNHCLLL